MKIGIDAKWFFEGPPSGKVVVRNLIKHIAEITSEDEFYIFLDKKERDKEFPYIRPNIHPIYVWAGNNLLSNVLVIPFSSWNLHLDIIVCQNFSPLFSNTSRYVIIYDVIFKTHPQFFSLIERLYLWPLYYLAHFAHRFCTISNSERMRIIEAGYCKPDLIDVIYLGVDEVFKPRENHNADSLQCVIKKYKLPSRFILYVGRLNVRKNIVNLVKALSHLRNKSIPLVIVGSNEGKTANLDILLTDLGVTEKVIFAGHVSDDDLPRIYTLASVFCFVSYAEAFGLPALEAMASGVPVVVSNRTCLPEICADAALYAEPDSPAEIADMIDHLLDDNQLWQQQRGRGLKRACDFTWRKSAEHLLESVYRTVKKL